VFYTIGFMEGKRQAVQPRVEGQSRGAVPSVAQGKAESSSKANVSAERGGVVGDRSAHEQLNWYKSVQGVEGEAQKSGDVKKSTVTAPAVETPAPTPPPQVAKAAAPPEQGSIVPPSKVRYSVQVGAYRQRHDAEAKAADLKAKGYASEVELSQSGNQIYFVIVGKFSSRADAVVMQHKLQKDGISSFIREK
jgi:cell division protein FtsN